MFCLDFSPANWEPIQLIAEQLATALFNDNTLQEKHRHHLDKLRWDASLGKCKLWRFIPASWDSQNCGIQLPDGLIKPTSHHFFVDNNMYCNIFDSYRIQKVVTASMKGIYIILGDSNLTMQQDLVSFDKLEDMPISYSSCIQVKIINTWWHQNATGNHNQHITHSSWSPPEGLPFAGYQIHHGKLGQIATTASWLCFLLSYHYAEVASCLKVHHNQWHIMNKQFCTSLKLQSNQDVSHKHRNFAKAKTAKGTHLLWQQHFTSKHLSKFMDLIISILDNDSVSQCCPIAHCIPRDPSTIVYMDSLSHTAGRFLTDCHFWWHLHSASMPLSVMQSSSNILPQPHHPHCIS